VARTNNFLEKTAIVCGLIVLFVAVVFGVRAQLGNVIAEGVVPGSPETESLALSGESISPSDPKTTWLAAVTRNQGFDQDSARILSDELLLALRLAPNDFRWWVERGRALEKARRFDEAEAHLVKAISLAPNYSASRWQIGNFYLRSGQREKSIEHFAIAAQGDAQYREEVFAIIDDFFERPSEHFTRIVGKDPDMLVTLAKYHAARGNFRESLSAWNRLSASDKNRMEVFGLVIAQAMHDKRAYLAAANILRDLGKENVRAGQIADGGFEENFRNYRDVFFGWKISSRDRVDARTDGRNAREGKRSLRLSYDGTLQEFVSNALQIVTVRSERRYRLTFWVRGEGIRSAGPPRVDVIDFTDSRPLVSSEPIKGTFDWVEQSLEFSVPKGVEGVLLAVNREGCGPECPIYGSLWLDGFKLQEID
jgi:tetratricopeptide (TPR) repeat protein